MSMLLEKGEGEKAERDINLLGARQKGGKLRAGGNGEASREQAGGTAGREGGGKPPIYE